MTRFYWPIAKVDGEQRMVWGYASTEAEDDQGESVTRAALAAALDDYMRFANIREMHRPSAVGVATEAELDDKGLYLAAKIVDEAAWQKVVEGVYKGFSIGGRITARDAADRRLITGLELIEISVVDRPANPEAVFDCWKRANAEADRPHDDAGAAGDGGAADIDYADPGFQADGRHRYPIDSEAHIRAAWAYIHQPSHAQRYTAPQLAHIRQRIAAAWRARIDDAGPPAAMATAPEAGGRAHKGLATVGMLAHGIADLGDLHDALAGDIDTAPLADRLWQIIDALRAVLCALAGADEVDAAGGDSGGDAAVLAMSIGGTLRKAQRLEAASLAESLGKLSRDIVPRLDALQQRVEQIAQTPLPPQTMAWGGRSFAGIAKREDSDAVLPADDVVAALARMSGEERTLALIKAAHANPITPARHLPAAPRR